MSQIQINPLTQQIIAGTVPNITNGFLIDRTCRNLSKRTIEFYRDELKHFQNYLNDIGVISIEEISPDIIRKYLLVLSEHRNEGGIHAAFRAIRALLNWWEQETDREFKNPISKVSPPKVNVQPKQGIEIQDVMKMIDACNSRMAIRDKAILFCLVDSGCRAREFLNWKLEDIDLITGTIQIRAGKGNKNRVVFLGKRSRKVLRRYLNTRDNLQSNSNVWITYENEKLQFAGLREIIRRRASDAGIPQPGLHDFRRCFALNMLRNGCDLVSLSRLMGHSSLEILKRYLALVDEDIHKAHMISNPIDNWEK